MTAKASEKKKAKSASKKKAGSKAAALSQADLKKLTCPCCKKHCPLSKPKCSKGKAVRDKVLKKD